MPLLLLIAILCLFVIPVFPLPEACPTSRISHSCSHIHNANSLPEPENVLYIQSFVSRITHHQRCGKLVLSISSCDANPRLLPQSLQLPQHHQIRIQKPIHALPHTRLLVLVQLPVLDVAARYAFSEACVCEGVYRCATLVYILPYNHWEQVDIHD
jgi:hypothetical protein